MCRSPTGADLLIQIRFEMLAGGGGSITDSQPEMRLHRWQHGWRSIHQTITTELSHNISLLAGNDITMQTGSLISWSGGELLVDNDRQPAVAFLCRT
jgi:hypothetical protein